MPNLKIYLEQPLWQSHGAVLCAALPALRDLLMRELEVPEAACQLAILPIHGLPDQPQCNVEFSFLMQSVRTPDRIREVCGVIRAHVGAIIGTPTAVRAMPLDPASYTALK